MTAPDCAGRCPGCFAEKGQANPCPHCGYDAEAERGMLLLPHGTRLDGHFVVGRVLGKPGGFGITYLAWDLSLATRVAIKEYLPRDLAGRRADQATVTPHSRDEGELFHFGLGQFLLEARTLAQLDHPNIVRVRQFFEANGTAYLVMDYYPGVPLAGHLERQGRLPEEQAKELLLPILDGLRAVHAKGLLHRDIKPQNIYLAQLESGGVRPILLDFGAARQAVGERSQSLSVVVSAGYAPFEQYHRKGHQGPWSDVYAAAATLYRMVTGEAPPDANERKDEDELRPATAFGVSRALSDALAAGLALSPKARPQTVQEFQALLWGSPPPRPKPEPILKPDPVPGPQPELALKPRRWWLLAVFSAALVVLGLGGLYLSHQAADDRAFAAAQQTDTPNAYQVYLDGCAPDGCWHQGEARQRLATVAQEQTRRDNAAFARASDQGTVADYQTYLDCCAADGCGHRAAAQALLSVAPGMVRIPAGRFTMGSPANEPQRQSDEGPQHQVHIAAFELGRHEVTLAQFRAFVAANPGYLTEAEKGDGCYGWNGTSWDENKAFSWRNVGFAQEDRSPVVCVSWNDAKDYVAWLKRQTGQAYRLPTEAEWEYAARAGTTTAFSTGNCITTDQANYNGNYDYAGCSPPQTAKTAP